MINSPAKEHYIELFRKNGFNCFPITRYHESIPNQKQDSRYKAERTPVNQSIKHNENYGVLPTKEGKNCIIDFDNKEKYRQFAELMIKEGYMVIETGMGWHIPVINLGNEATKTELFDYSFQQTKIIEIQGFKQYVVGVGSTIFHDKLQKEITYENKGSDKIWNLKGKNYHELIEKICEVCNVTSKKNDSRFSDRDQRQRFKDGKIPTKKTSNHYFFNAGLVCNTEGLTRDEAIERIRKIYDKWVDSDNFSNRPFSNIITKINDVYDNDRKITKGNTSGNNNKLDRTEIANTIQAERKLFSDVTTSEIVENKNGFLEKINKSLKKEIYADYKELEEADYNSILFKLLSGSPDLPQTNKDEIVFKNYKINTKTKKESKSDDIADLGFKDYDYLPKTKKNEPTKFLKILFGNVDKKEYPRIKAGLRGILQNHLDSRISIIHGSSGSGKSTPLTILVKVLGDEYSLIMELDQLLSDKFMKAKVKNKRLLVIQDLPPIFKDFTPIKSLTGEVVRSEREFMKDSTQFDSKLKIWASCNYLAKIPDNEKNAMYTRRLSLIHNTRTVAYDENPSFAEEIAKEEGEKIVSWILNLDDKECQYEDGTTVKREWESISSPEVEYMTKYWKSEEVLDKIPIMTLRKDFEEKYQMSIPLKQFIKSIEDQGYYIYKNMVNDISPIKQPKIKSKTNWGIEGY